MTLIRDLTDHKEPGNEFPNLNQIITVSKLLTRIIIYQLQLGKAE